MQKYIVLIFIFILNYPVSGVAQQAENKQDEFGDIPLSHGNTMLWRIEGNGLENPSYLFGTIHLIPEEHYHLGTRVVEILAHCDYVVFEMTLDPASQMQAMMGAMLEDGKTLRDLMDNQQFEVFQSYMIDTFGYGQIEFAAFQRMKPVFLSQMFAQQMMVDSEVISYELEIKELAESSEIPIYGLETVSQQIGFFDAIPLEDQIDMLMTSLENYGQEEEKLNRLFELYRTQNLHELYEFMSGEFDDLMRFSDVLLNDRNKAWIPEISNYVKNGTHFIAVGAGHLPGEKGVINLLRKEGFQLTPVSTEKKN